MKILVIGGGGREHALVWKLSKSPLVRKLYALPGNSGIEQFAQIESISVDRVDDILSFVKREGIDLTLVGPELPLTLGLVDRLEAEKRPVIGPLSLAAEIEGSKIFSKQFMERHRIPTAKGRTVDALPEAIEFFKQTSSPYVVKADGLAAGKGVIIAQSEEEATQAVKSMLEGKELGQAGRRCLVEEFLQGEEVSFIVLTDGEKTWPLVSSQDYKRVGDGDQGPNTGGMGAFAPSPLLTDALRDRVLSEVIQPTIDGLADEGRPYRGFLYAGLMISPDGNNKPKIHVLEFNARLGDPETQVILPLLKDDLVEIFMEMNSGQLKKDSLSFENKKGITVVMASVGYPGSYEKGKEIRGLSAIDETQETFVFHAGTKKQGNQWLTQGGRVLAVTALGSTFTEAHEKVYGAVEKISFSGCHFRRDIGKKVINV